MNLATLRPRTQTFLAVAVPLVCLLVGLFVVWPAVSRLRQTGQELKTTQTTITQKQQVIAPADAAAQGRELVLAVALPSEEEPIKFLRQFAELCRVSSVSLSSVRESAPARTPAPAPAPSAGSTTAAPASKGGPSQLGGPTPIVPTSVSEVTDQVSVEGTFRDLLTLLVRMEGFERILSVNQCQVTGTTKSYPRLKMGFTLTRFVAKPQAPAAPAAPSASGGGRSG